MPTIKRTAAAMALLLATGAAAQIHDPRAIAADPAAAAGPIAPRLEGLGDHHFEITTASPGSQEFFDQGLRLTYGFNHSEALRAFKEAARLDPGNAMAYWGWALVLGPNLNLPMLPDVVEQAYQAIEQAMARREGISERERAYVEALAKRYGPDPEEPRAQLDLDYAEAMRELVRRYPDDLDAATLYAAALMNLSPWNYWYGDGLPRPNGAEIVDVLESVLDRDPAHAGALHYLIHALEAVHPKRAEASADRLQGLMPGAGHIVHMPSHIYMRVGRYGDSWEANRKAVEADEGYITQCRAQGLYPLGYYPHNIHFMAWSAMLQGRSAEALAAARKIVDKIPPDMVGNSWGLYETFLSQPIFVMVRFGRWQELLAEPAPAEEARFITGMWRYGRALAFTHTGELRRARGEHKALVEIRDALEGEPYGVGFGAASTLLTIADEVVAGEMAARRRKFDAALGHLERAVRLEDTLLYNEPPDWYFPVRHLLGAVLLEAGYPAEAEAVYWADLRKNPENGYSLLGVVQSLEAQQRPEEALQIRRRFERAWAEADVELKSSRF